MLGRCCIRCGNSLLSGSAALVKRTSIISTSRGLPTRPVKVVVGVRDFIGPVVWIGAAGIAEIVYRCAVGVEKKSVMNRKSNKPEQTRLQGHSESSPLFDWKLGTTKNTGDSKDSNRVDMETLHTTQNGSSSYALSLSSVSFILVAAEVVKFVLGAPSPQRAMNHANVSTYSKQFVKSYLIHIFFKSKSTVISLALCTTGLLLLVPNLPSCIGPGECVKMYSQVGLLSVALGTLFNFVSKGPQFHPLGGHSIAAVYGVVGYLLQSNAETNNIYLFNDTVSVGLKSVAVALFTFESVLLVLSRRTGFFRYFTGREVTLSAFLLGSLYHYVRPNYIRTPSN